jgi:hypothetical protein
MSLVRRWLYPQEIEILENVRWFVIVAAAATFLHVVTGSLEERQVSGFITTMLRWLESFMVVCDVVVLFASLLVHVIIRLRQTFLLLNVDIFAVAKRQAPPRK